MHLVQQLDLVQLRTALLLSWVVHWAVLLLLWVGGSDCHDSDYLD